MPDEPDWTDTSRLIAWTVSTAGSDGLYIAFSASHLPVTLQLPIWPGRTWQPVIDTGKVCLSVSLPLHASGHVHVSENLLHIHCHDSTRRIILTSSH